VQPHDTNEQACQAGVSPASATNLTPDIDPTIALRMETQHVAETALIAGCRDARAVDFHDSVLAVLFGLEHGEGDADVAAILGVPETSVRNLRHALRTFEAVIRVSIHRSTGNAGKENPPQVRRI
jgi:hypothetical protein